MDGVINDVIKFEPTTTGHKRQRNPAIMWIPLFSCVFIV